MKRTQVVREVASTLHTTEASLEGALASSKQALERLIAAKVELGLTGTFGDASIARMKDSVAALEQARASMIESHQEAYAILTTLNLRTVSYDPTYKMGSVAEEDRAA